jgi:hypothetical protein
MYSQGAGIVFGFHGCDKSVAEKIINLKEPLNQSLNNYDWLGNGIYFWENSPSRALEFAKEMKSKNKINTPCVIGSFIQLGNCFDLLDFENLQYLKYGYVLVKSLFDKQNEALPLNKVAKDSNEFLLRQLDCAVIEGIHKIRIQQALESFDSVRGVFWEGQELYPNAGFREKDHIQICIRNPNCIRGFFYPREYNKQFKTV